MLNDLLVCVALGGALGAAATFVLRGEFDAALPLNVVVGAAGALLGDGLGLPALGIGGEASPVIDSARIAASVAGAILLLAVANLHFHDEVR